MHNRTQIKTCLFICLLIALIGPIAVFVGIGVGVGAGKITVQEQLKPGGIYELPTIPVINTGDEPSEFGVSLDYDNHQPELQPPKEWFSLEPSTFHLEPGKSQLVKTTLTVPIKAVPGNYFVYVEAHPVKGSVAGKTSVGIAAAVKLYFTIAPANFFQGIYYRITSFIVRTAPWSYVAFAIIGIAIVIVILRRFISFNLGVSFKKK